MLNLFNLKEKNKLLKPIKNQEKRTSKHFPSPIREWKNSIYVFNKNSLNLIPSTTLLVTNMIKSYFNLYNKRLELKMRSKRLLLRLRRSSLNKYYISSGGFKHTNNKVFINLYVFNRQKRNYILTIKKWYLRTFLKKLNQNSRKKSNQNINLNLIKRLKTINNKGIQAVKLINKDKYLLIKALNTINNNNKYKINTFKSLSNYTENFYKDLIQKSLKKIKMYFYYKQLLHINMSKLNYTYLQYLKKHLEKIYNKNVEFNLINLKRFYLNSDILSESISTKLSRNRRKMVKYMNNLKNKVKIKKKKDFIIYSPTSRPELEKDNLASSNLLLQNHIISNLKYRHVTGFRLEAKGRLSKRFTASRSVSKTRYNGGISDFDSSYRGLSSVLLKGNLKSNTQYTKLSSKTRIGSFGIKGWVSGN